MTDAPAAVSTDRADRVAEALQEREADMLLVTDLVNVRWLTGFTGSNAAVVVGREGSRRFVTDFRYLTQSAEEVDPAWEREIAVDLLAGVVKGLPGSGELRLAFDDAHMSVKDHARLAGMLRAGIELVRRGRRDRDAAGGQGRRRARGDPRRGAAGRRRADRGPRARARGPHRARGGARPRVHHAPHGRAGRLLPADRGRRRARRAPARRRRATCAIPAGTLVVVDWGAQLDGYASDCTRTYATGDIDPRDGEVYELVLQAQEAALAAVRPGPTGREVDAVARAIIDAAGHAEHFGHGLGHGVGLDVHEGPRLSKQGETALGGRHGRHRRARRLRARRGRRAHRGSRGRHRRRRRGRVLAAQGAAGRR